MAEWLKRSLPSSQKTLQRTRTDLPVLIVGAGPAGIAGAVELCQKGIRFEGIERSHRPGGLWDRTNPWSPAYDSLITNSSVATTHLQLRQPREWPAYLPRELAFQHLMTVAARHQVAEHYRFHTQLTSLERLSDGAWRAQFEDLKKQTTEYKEYRAVILANGNQSIESARSPEMLHRQALESKLLVLHAAQYRNPTPFAGMRVLIVGMGNSGAEIATEVSRFARRTLLSARTRPWIAPLYVLGKPADEFVVSGSELPLWIEIPFYRLLQKWYVGRRPPRPAGRAAYDILDRLPITDRGIVHAMASGEVELRSNVKGIREGQVRFENSQENPEEIDAVIFATGYQRSYPFLSDALSPFGSRGISNFLLLFSPEERGLLFLPEVIVPQGAWPLFVSQAKALAVYLEAEAQETPAICQFDSLRATPGPDLKGHLFRLADIYHVHPRRYREHLEFFMKWIVH